MFGGTFSKFNCDLTELLKRNRYLDFLNYILLPYCNKGQNFTNKTGIILRTNAHLLSNTDGCLFVCALPTCRTLRGTSQRTYSTQSNTECDTKAANYNVTQLRHFTQPYKMGGKEKERKKSKVDEKRTKLLSV